VAFFSLVFFHPKDKDCIMSMVDFYYRKKKEKLVSIGI